MKEIRPEFTEEEYGCLRAVGTDPGNDPLSAAQMLSEEISKNRDALNQIIRRETAADIRLYEDDVIRMEMAMTELEGIVTAFILEVLKEVR